MGVRVALRASAESQQQSRDENLDRRHGSISVVHCPAYATGLPLPLSLNDSGDGVLLRRWAAILINRVGAARAGGGFALVPFQAAERSSNAPVQKLEFQVHPRNRVEGAAAPPNGSLDSRLIGPSPGSS